jgi:hypothetical protein
MGVHKIRGEKALLGRHRSSVVSPIKLNAVYLNKKIKNGLRTILTETTTKEKFKLRKWVDPDC